MPVDVIYAPVPPPPDDLREPLALHRELDVPDGARLILHVGRMEQWKGQRLLLDSLATLTARSDWVCVLVGGAQQPTEHQYLASLRAVAAGPALAGRVRFAGEREDVPDLLATADIAALPSTAPEGFGIALVEALYSGTAVVATAIGPTTEIADGSCAILIPPNDVPALAAALDTLLSDTERRSRLGQAGRRRAAEICSPTTQLAKVAAALEKAVKG